MNVHKQKDEILDKHKDMSYEVARYRYEYAVNKHYSFLPSVKKVSLTNGEEYTTWTDEDFNKMHYWEFVENYYQVVYDEKRKLYEREHPLTITFENKDIVITDPCYILDEEKFDDMTNSLYRIEDTTYQSKDMIMRDTIYGDWYCEVYDSNNGNVIGNFSADSGMVCVMATDNELVVQNELENIPKECRTIIKNFTGTIYIKRIPYEGCDKIVVEGIGNVNFSTL